jgi:hypothetical protein
MNMSRMSWLPLIVTAVASARPPRPRISRWVGQAVPPLTGASTDRAPLASRHPGHRPGVRLRSGCEQSKCGELR